jgi:hypothetical protein
MPRKPFTKLRTASGLTMALGLGLGLASMLGLAGCKPDICKDPTLPQAERCRSCTPKNSKNDEVLARLDPTQLPWPVRKNVENCIDQHENDLFLTKQGLRECIETDANLDGPTKAAVVELINRSNVMEQADLEAFHMNCAAINLAPPVMTIPTANPTMPPPRLDPPELGPSTAPASPSVRPTVQPRPLPSAPPPAPSSPSDPLL